MPSHVHIQRAYCTLELQELSLDNLEAHLIFGESPENFVMGV